MCQHADDGAFLDVKDVGVDKGSYNGIRNDGLCKEKFEELVTMKTNSGTEFWDVYAAKSEVSDSNGEPEQQCGRQRKRAPRERIRAPIGGAYAFQGGAYLYPTIWGKNLKPNFL